jgi:2-phosphosulfolactate phosphatase
MPDRRKDPLDAPSIVRRPGALPSRPALAARPATSPFDQHDFHARFEWGVAGVRTLTPFVDLIVIVDVLSFSTAVSIAVEQGARVVPYRFHDVTAAEHARAIGAILASPNRRMPGPSLSPASLQSLRAGDLLVLPSPNGATCAVEAAASGAMVVAGCLRNAAAVGRLVASHGGAVAVVAAGEAWPDGGLRPAVEDLIGAGAIVAAVEADTLSPEARAAAAAFRGIRGKLARILLESASGRELAAAGLEADVDLAADLDATDLVPVLVDGAFAGGMG